MPVVHGHHDCSVFDLYTDKFRAPPVNLIQGMTPWGGYPVSCFTTESDGWQHADYTCREFNDVPDGKGEGD